MPILKGDEGPELHYVEVGSGSPPLLLIHGMNCDHTWWGPQIEHFRDRHRIVSIDVRGHGRSGKPQAGYTVPELAADVAWLARRIGLTKPIAIGHSMGGVIALQLAASFPDLPGAVVILDSPICPPPETRVAIAPLLAGLRGGDWRQAQRQLGELCLLPTSDPALRARVVAAEHAPQHVLAAVLDAIFSCDTAAAAAACKVPVLFLSASHVASDLTRFRELCPQLVTGQTVGAGHYHHLETPEQVNSMIERFLATSSVERR
jgi:pimeloyl-ACP methyl ester carboxylesterase